MTVIASFEDLSTDDVEWVMARADEWSRGRPRSVTTGQVLGLVFLQDSLRTRVGFAAAGARLGMVPVEVRGVRQTPRSMPESIADTVRTVAAYSDLVVVRADAEFAVPKGVRVPVLNGGDAGARAEHPSQALVDQFALRRVPRGRGVVGVCGDLRMRAVRSLLKSFVRWPPQALVVMTDEALCGDLTIPAELGPLVTFGTWRDLGDLDVLYLAGIPHGAVGEPSRTALRLTLPRMAALPSSCTVLSPLPVIDEVESGVDADPRWGAHWQSADGLYVRMALLELMLDGDGDGPRR